MPGWQASLPKAHVLSEPVANTLSCSIENQSLAIQLPREMQDPNLTIVAVDHASPWPFLPAHVVRLAPGQPVMLIATNGLAWHRIVGQDYFSQHPEVAARE